MKKNKGRAVVGALIAGFVSNFGVGCSDRQAVADADPLVDTGAMVEMGELRLALETDTNERFRLVNASFEVRDSNGAVASYAELRQ